MDYIRCPNNHFYDITKFSRCPVCNKSDNTEWQWNRDVKPPIKESDLPISVRETNILDSKSSIDDSSPTIPDIPIDPLTGNDPVVGWLICVDGPNRGKDYRLHSGNNIIGRGNHMDIQIQGDEYMSRGNAVVISYDDIGNSFYVKAGETRNTVRVNDKRITSSTTLNIYDKISVGHTELVFMPLCDENFSWEKYKE